MTLHSTHCENVLLRSGVESVIIFGSVAIRLIRRFYDFMASTSLVEIADEIKTPRHVDLQRIFTHQKNLAYGNLFVKQSVVDKRIGLNAVTNARSGQQFATFL